MARKILVRLDGEGNWGREIAEVRGQIVEVGSSPLQSDL
jgi:hypothetical protein